MDGHGVTITSARGRSAGSGRRPHRKKPIRRFEGNPMHHRADLANQALRNHPLLAFPLKSPDAGHAHRTRVARKAGGRRTRHPPRPLPANRHCRVLFSSIPIPVFQFPLTRAQNSADVPSNLFCVSKSYHLPRPRSSGSPLRPGFPVANNRSRQWPVQRFECRDVGGSVVHELAGALHPGMGQRPRAAHRRIGPNADP